MVQIKEGNLFNTDAKIIVHQVNCQGIMGSGVARQVKDRYPHVYDEYKKFTISAKNKSENFLGTILCVPLQKEFVSLASLGDISYNGSYIANLFGQDRYGYDGKCYTDLKALKRGFEYVNALTYLKNNLYNAKIAMPYKIGCARGGADWSLVRELINDIFIERNVELWKLKGDEDNVYI